MNVDLQPLHTCLLTILGHLHATDNALVLLTFELSLHWDLEYLSLFPNPITHLVFSLLDSHQDLVLITSVVYGYLPLVSSQWIWLWSVHNNQGYMLIVMWVFPVLVNVRYSWAQTVYLCLFVSATRNVVWLCLINNPFTIIVCLLVFPSSRH